MIQKTRIPAVAWVLVWIGPLEAVAQLVTEEIDLGAGWNAVWVNVEPEPSSLDMILAAQVPALNYQSIWAFEPVGSAPGSVDATAGRWFVHDRELPAAVNTLRSLQGMRGYLIRMNAPGRLTISGTPIARTRQLVSRTSNLIGAMIDPNAPVPLSFERYFAHPGAQGKVLLSGSPPRHDIFKIVNDVLVRHSISGAIESNVAYWINVVQDFESRGPIDVKATVDGFHFGLTTSRRTVTVEVPGANGDRSLTFRALPCGFPDDASCVPPAGGIDWLEYRDPNVTGKSAWQPLAKGVTFTVPEGQSVLDLDVRARRTRSMRGEDTPGELSTFLEVSDGQGGRVLLGADAEIQPIFGSWVGRATVTKVGVHPVVQDLPLEQAEAEPFGITLILDLPAPSAQRGPIGPRLLDSLEFAIQRDGRSLTQRFHAILFDRPIDLIEDAADPLDPLGATGTLSAELFIPADDPLNPYRHRTHPEHRLGYDITRVITLKLERREDSLVDELAGLDGTFGSNLLAGLYTEVITGVSRDPITVQGTFRLSRLSESGPPVSGP